MIMIVTRMLVSKIIRPREDYIHAGELAFLRRKSVPVCICASIYIDT